MPQRPKSADQQATRQRLLQAAGEVFAEQGFQQATVREICRRAHANVAAVNYHFRDKEELYQEVFRNAHLAATGMVAQAVGQVAKLSPRDQLAAFISTFVHHLLNPDRPAWVARLMAHELVNPTHALDLVVRDSIRPHQEQLQQIIRALAPHLPEEARRHCGGSIMAQCLFFKQCQPVIHRLYPDIDFRNPAQIDYLAQHITSFTLAAIAGMELVARRTKS